MSEIKKDSFVDGFVLVALYNDKKSTLAKKFLYIPNEYNFANRRIISDEYKDRDLENNFKELNAGSVLESTNFLLGTESSIDEDYLETDVLNNETSKIFKMETSFENTQGNFEGEFEIKVKEIYELIVDKLEDFSDTKLRLVNFEVKNNVANIIKDNDLKQEKDKLKSLFGNEDSRRLRMKMQVII
jgi:hypothetical protein